MLRHYQITRIKIVRTAHMQRVGCFRQQKRGKGLFWSWRLRAWPRETSPFGIKEALLPLPTSAARFRPFFKIIFIHNSHLTPPKSAVQQPTPFSQLGSAPQALITSAGDSLGLCNLHLTQRGESEGDCVPVVTTGAAPVGIFASTGSWKLS